MNREELDSYFMDIAIEIARKARFPYGAVVVRDDKIIGRSDEETFINKTPYTHAELMAIESACRSSLNLYGELKGATLYTTCEPCIMCMGAILYEGISRIVYACTIEDSSKYVEKEIEIKIDELIKLTNGNIELMKEFKRMEALDILKEYQRKCNCDGKNENLL